MNRRYTSTLALLAVSAGVLAFAQFSERRTSAGPAAVSKLLLAFKQPMPGGAAAGLPLIFDCPSVQTVRAEAFTSRSTDSVRFREVLASHEIELNQGPGEMSNIELASHAIDGLIVRPFEVFSFNSAVGPRAEDRGFRPGLMFENGEVITGIGGGICIVSTALYNAALKAGLKIIERGPHSAAVRYAAPGLDSAVAFGCLDLRFKNDTGCPVVVHSRIEDGKLIVMLLGRKRAGIEVAIASEDYVQLPCRVIETEDPTVPEGTVRVKTLARTGFEVTTVRIVRHNGKIVSREVLSRDRVPPRDKIVLVPPRPNEVGPAAAAEPAKAAPEPPNVGPCSPAPPTYPTDERLSQPKPQEPSGSAESPAAVSLGISGTLERK